MTASACRCAPSRRWASTRRARSRRTRPRCCTPSCRPGSPAWRTSSWSARPAPDGRVPDVKLAAAAIAGADRVFCASGAQAVAALAYGTRDHPARRQDLRARQHLRHAGQARRLRRRRHRLDLRADRDRGRRRRDRRPGDLRRRPDRPGRARRAGRADLHHRARERWPRRSSRRSRSGSRCCRGRGRRRALESRGGAVVAASIEEAVALASEYAPEHLCILAKDARRLATLVKNAGGVFLGEARPRRSATTRPAPATSCRPAARRASPRPSACRTSSSSAPSSTSRTTRLRPRPGRRHHRARRGPRRPRARHRGEAAADEPRASASSAGCSRTCWPTPPYVAVEPPDEAGAAPRLPAERIVKLDANENPYGPSPRAGEALATPRRLPHLPGPGAAQAARGAGPLRRLRPRVGHRRRRQRRADRPAGAAVRARRARRSSTSRRPSACTPSSPASRAPASINVQRRDDSRASICERRLRRPRRRAPDLRRVAEQPDRHAAAATTS